MGGEANQLTKNSKLDSIKSVTAATITANSTNGFTVASQTKACMYIIGADINTLCQILINANAAGTVTYEKIGEAPSIQANTTGANKLDIISSSSTNPAAYIICFYGSVTKA